MTSRVTLYTRAECCLCDAMKAVVRRVADEIPLVIEEIDVDSTAELQAQYGHEVPVLLVNGRKAFKYQVTVQELRTRLQTLRGRREP